MSARVILLHGFTGTPLGWDAVCMQMSRRFEFVALPLLGHHPALCTGLETTFEDELDRLAGEMPAADPVDIVGYSLGARLALGLAVRHPALVRRAVLIGANPGVQTAGERRARAEADERWARQLENDGLEAFVAQWEALPLFATQRRLPEHVLVAQQRERLSHDPRGLARSLRVTGLAQMPDYWTELGRIGPRVHWVAGALDEKFRALGQRAADLSQRPLSLVEDAGHNVPLERPAALARLLDEVLA